MQATSSVSTDNVKVIKLLVQQIVVKLYKTDSVLVCATTTKLAVIIFVYV